MASSIDIASNALVLIGDDPISALSESTAASNLYADTYEYVLSQHPWTFAMKEQDFSRLSQAPDSETGYQYAYQRPADLIRLWAVLPTQDYQVVSEFIYSNASSLWGRFIFKPDESQLPPYFVKCLQYKLASDFSMSVAEDDQKMMIFEKKYEKALSESKTIDSQQHPYARIRGNPIRRRR